jgi:hypothetical protein
MTREALLALIGGAALVFACDGKFEFGDDGGLAGSAGESHGSDGPEEGECEECVSLGLTCDDDGYPCVECLSDQDCTDGNDDPARPRCDKELRRCVGCSEQEHCPRGFTCDRVIRSCVVGCATDTTSPSCDNNFLFCDEDRSVCAVCFDNDHCQHSLAGQYCVASGTRCVECERNDDCYDDDQVCDPTSFRCVECASYRDCAQGKLCDPRSHTCVEFFEPADQTR